MGDNRKFAGSIPNLVFVGLLFLGVAVGMLWGATMAGTLIGLGAGFIAMAIIRFATNRKKGETGSAAKPDNE